MLNMHGKDNNQHQRIATDSFVLTFVRIVTLSVSIVQTMILSRILSTNEYGTYSEALLIISFLAPFFSLGLTDSINYFFNKTEEKGIRNSYISTIFGLSIIAGGFGGLMIILLRNSIALYFGNTSILPLVVYIAFRPCLQNIIALYQPLYISNNFAKAIAIRNLLVSVSQIAIVGIVALLTNSLVLIFELLLLLDLVQIVLFALFYNKKCDPIRLSGFSIELIKPILRFAIPMLLATSISTINLSMDKLMISKFMTVEDYALYANMGKELPFSFVISSFTVVVTPVVVKLLAEKDSENFRKLWANYLEIGYLLTWPLCVGAIVVAPLLIEVLYSKTYLTDVGVSIFRIYSIVAMFRFTYFGMIPSALGKTKIVFKYSLIGMIINLLLNYLLFQLFGMLGPSIATLISMFVSATLYFRKSLRLVNLRFFEIVSIKRLIDVLLIMALGTVSVCSIDYASQYITNNVFIRLLFEYLVFVAICYGLSHKRIRSLISNMNHLRGIHS